jgi:stage III sporulation protein AE
MLSALGHRGVGAISRGVKDLFGRITGICTALLTAAISMQTVIASAADTAALRAAKYATSGLIPIVGGAVAGAISTLTAAMSYAKGVVGGGAVAVLLYLAISPLALLLLYRLSLSVVIILSEFIGVPTASGLFTSYRFALDMTLTVYTLSALIYLFMIVIFIWIGGSI